MADRVADRQFQTEVFPNELAVIRQRRLNAALPPPALDVTTPSLQHDLMGLALSGGGIRSASFSLGVLQALSASGLLPRVDYLSTVSGGGLIGSSVSSLLNSPKTSAEPDQFPLGFDPGKVERPAIRYLRNHTRWLAPGGGLDDIRLPAVILRGILDNVAVLLPLLMIAVLLTEQLFNLAYRWGMDKVQYVPIAGVAAFVGVALVQPVLYRVFAGRYLDSWSARNQYERVLAISLVLVVLVFVLIPMFLLVQQAIDLDWDEVKDVYRTHRIVFWSGAIGVALLLGAAGKYAFEAPDRLIGKLSLVVVGLVGHAIVFGLYLLLTLIQVDSPVLDYHGAVNASPLADLQSGHVTPMLEAELDAMGFPVSAGADIRSLGSGSYTRWLIRSGADDYIVTRWGDTLRVVNTLGWDGETDEVFLAVGILGLLYAVCFSNSNVTSAHGFFRDRMSRAFLMTEEDGAIEHCDDLKLSQLNDPGSTAPYHLVNVTLNLQGARDLDLAGRDADFFVLASQYSGSPTTGYCRTTELEKLDPHLNLGTAMAISGAGLSPNQGTSTVTPLVYLTALLNLRLDYWLANPRRVSSTSALRRLRLSASVGPVYLLKEAWGLLDGRGPFVNVSDGGHLENLGVYELLRRRCRWIIAVDASEDQAMSFPCLMDMIRYARIDLGITIAIDVEELRLTASGTSTRSARHFTVGVIDYGDEQCGHLVYVKSSMTGDEPETIRQYREMNPTFPQESSSNQFFTERQFEAYRALGEHIITDMLAKDIGADWPVQPHVGRALLREEVV